MEKTDMLKKIVTNPSSVWHYLLGNYRYQLYYYFLKKKGVMKHVLTKSPLMRQHIFEQIQYRIKVMNKQCYNNGACIKCGCDTTQLQMANKACDGYCYPPMMNRKDWRLKRRIYVPLKIDGVKTTGVWIYIENKYQLFIETKTGYLRYK